jgi:Secretion system C-terminal sorting domain
MKLKSVFITFLVLACGIIASAQTNLQNGDFETWRLREFRNGEKCCGRNIDMLYYWGMSEQLTGLNYNKFVFRETDSSVVHSGLICVKLVSDTTYLNDLVLAPGIIAYGAMQDSASTAVTIGPVIQSTGLPLPMSANPISLNFYMKMEHAATDTPYYVYVFTKWDSIAWKEDTLAYDQTDIPDDPENMNQWVRYSDSIHYTAPGIADTVRILFFGGRFGDANLQGNVTYLDDASLYYPGTGLASLSGKPVAEVFPNPATRVLNVKTSEYQPGNLFAIYDATGRSIKNVMIENQNTVIDVSNLEAGNYFYRLTDKGKVMIAQGNFIITK